MSSKAGPATHQLAERDALRLGNLADDVLVINTISETTTAEPWMQEPLPQRTDQGRSS